MSKVTLSKIIDIISGGTPKTSISEYWDNGTIGWLSVTDFNNDIRYVYDTEKKITEAGMENSNTRLLQKDDLIISARGTVGALAQIGTPMCFNQSCFGLRGKKGIVENGFLYYCLKNYVSNIKRRSQGSVFDTINLQSFDLMEIDIPNISTQQKIAAVLSALDAKIELNQRINAELESMAKTLYDYWFVQFEFPNEKGKPYKSAGGKMVWNEELKREIPLGWEVEELGKHSQTFRGVTYKKEDVKKPSDKNTIPILRATNISNGVIDVNDMVYVPEELVSEDQMMEKFDVLITMSSGSKAHVGKNAFYYYDDKVSFGAFCSKLSANKSMRFYVNIHMQSDGFKKYISNVGLGTNINNLTNKHITEYKLLIPPKEILLQFENTVEGFYNKIGNNMKESQTLTELRDWLLPMLMNGQVSAL